ncbi:N-alpha-acetyltransferase 38, NatC auxiliary subunit isoform X2 [Aquarana catesbeiana]|uniref:N-alpha-acetyltransferase 38, NatC auxiliary subunit isoform X2 n=1 Tax=Aquarana catesbeiana TaxID=8400 RepID=UPI003CC9A23F
MAAVLEENGCSPPPGDLDVGPRNNARRKLQTLLNKNMRIEMTDGRSLIGCFLCTDRDCNVILGSAQEFLRPSGNWQRGRRQQWEEMAAAGRDSSRRRRWEGDNG